MISPDILQKLRDIVGEEHVDNSPVNTYIYGADSSLHRHPPDVVVQPHTPEEISEIMKLANENLIPVVPRGAGTGLTGMAVPIKGGILLDMTLMDRILEIKVEDLNCTVEPGVIYADLNNALKSYGYFFPPSPGSGDVCTIGGMVAGNASGMRAIKYGATRDYVIGLEFVLPTGEIVNVGTRTIKNASGYHLEKLLVGSEGTLAIVTKVTLRISLLPKKRGLVVGTFNGLEEAGNAISAVIAGGIVPSALEIMDKNCLHAVIDATHAPLPRADGLVIAELDGSIEELDEDMPKVAEIFKKKGAGTVEYSRDPEKMEKIWESRKAVLPSLSRLGEKVSVMVPDDMSIPISQLGKAAASFEATAEKYGITLGTYGHAGDGNLHTRILIDPLDTGDWERLEKALDEIYRAAQALGATTSGEHGIGISKARYFKWERGGMPMELMRRIKHVFDPNNILNPGKIFEGSGDVFEDSRYASALRMLETEKEQ